jgi:hypothetical protein
VAGDDDEPEKSRVGRALRRIAAVVGIIAVGVPLVFAIWPDLKPCLSGSDAAFTGAPVFPQVRFHDHLIRNGVPKEKVLTEPNLLGAEVRFSYRTTGYRGSTLAVTWSLVQIERDETLGAVVTGQDRALARTFTPGDCSEGGGKDLFVQIPQHRKRYRIVLELYRDQGLTERIALMESDPFRG